MNSILPYTIDDFFSSTSIGSIERAITNNLYGINHVGAPSMVPSIKNYYGYTFFTRPQLNLQSDNIRNYRTFYPLLTANELSIQRFVRTMLDPRLMYGFGNAQVQMAGISSPFVDPLQAFITPLTNNITNLSGWPDMVNPTFTSDQGLYREAYSQVDGITEIYNDFDLTATFRNTRGSPILALFAMWEIYQSKVFDGTLVPYPDFIIENALDYTTRIYRISLDQDKKTVATISATGASFPVSLPIGSLSDFDNSTPLNQSFKDISIQFKCVGAIYMDDVLISEFNDVVCIFNPSMKDDVRETVMVKIPSALRTIFNNRGYARINPNNYELEWWISKETYNQRIQGVGLVGVNNSNFLNDIPSGV